MGEFCLAIAFLKAFGVFLQAAAFAVNPMDYIRPLPPKGGTSNALSFSERRIATCRVL
jgi:hypothetical protein